MFNKKYPKKTNMKKEIKIKNLKNHQYLISSMAEYLSIIKIATGDYGKDI